MMNITNMNDWGKDTRKMRIPVIFDKPPMGEEN
jgi:hypothetical protein